MTVRRRPGLFFPKRLSVGAGSMPAALRICHTRGRRERVSQAGQLTVDAPVAPARVIAGHLQDQRLHGRRGPGPSRAAARISQYRWTRSACQRSRVRGEMSKRSSRRWPWGSSRACPARTARSGHDRRGALTWRWSTATWSGGPGARFLRAPRPRSRRAGAPAGKSDAKLIRLGQHGVEWRAFAATSRNFSPRKPACG